MIELIERHRSALESICRQFGVAKLEVFGSASTGTFDSAKSDLDFLVEFKAGESLGPWLRRFTDLQASLEALLGRPVDLVMPGAMRNPYFIREVNRSRVTLYAA